MASDSRSGTFVVELPVRYRDLDPRHHVNHAVYVTYLEDAKAAFFDDVLGVPLDDAPTVVRALEIEFSGSITLGEVVRVALVVTDVGGTSFTIEYDVSADGEAVASGRTVSVVIDPSSGDAVPVPADWRDRIQSHAGEP